MPIQSAEVLVVGKSDFHRLWNRDADKVLEIHFAQ